MKARVRASPRAATKRTPQRSGEAPWPAEPRRRAARRLHPPVRSAGSGAGPSFNDLIRPGPEWGRDRQAEGLGGLQVDDGIELRWLLDGQIGRLGSLENAVDIGDGAPQNSEAAPCYHPGS